MTHTATETDIARPVVEHLQGLYGGHAVHAEVVYGIRRIDLVVRPNGSDGTVFVYECKAQLDDRVIEQARDWQGISDGTYVVVPWPARMSDEFSNRMHTLEQYGVGLIVVRGDKWEMQVEARPNMNAQTDELHRWVDRHERASIHNDAGSKTAKTSPQSVFAKRINDALAEGEIIYIKTVFREFDPPCSKRSTRNFVHRMWKDGEFKGKWEKWGEGNEVIIPA